MRHTGVPLSSPTPMRLDVEAEEEYRCDFGLNLDRRGLIEEGGLRASGVDESGEARILELPDHLSTWPRCSCRRSPLPMIVHTISWSPRSKSSSSFARTGTPRGAPHGLLAIPGFVNSLVANRGPPTVDFHQ